MQKGFGSKMNNTENNYSDLSAFLHHKLFPYDLLEFESVSKKGYINESEECGDILQDEPLDMGKKNDKEELVEKETNSNAMKIAMSSLLPEKKEEQCREFRCNFEGCEKVYKSKENLTLHVKNIHEKLKPYKCRFCMTGFSHRNGKTYHERRFHINYLPYHCSYENCTHSFASKSAMCSHINSAHLNIKRHKRKNEDKDRNITQT